MYGSDKLKSHLEMKLFGSELNSEYFNNYLLLLLDLDMYTKPEK